MRGLLCLAVLAAISALVIGEVCRNVSTCAHVSCPESDYDPACLRSECTCSHARHNCTVVGDCAGQGCNRNYHCVDGKCTCFGNFNGGK